jgi:hygromycin-B 7''-O-kinase
LSSDPRTIATALRDERALGAELRPFAAGSVPVFAVGTESVIKLFPAEEQTFFETEAAALSRVAGLLSIPTPHLIASGERAGWWYIVMTQLRGDSLAEAWPRIGADDRRRLMRDVGIALAELHAVPTHDLAPLATNWQNFMNAQRAACRERQLAKGLASPWADAIEDFLERWTPSDDGRRVLLHTEVMREHLLVERRQRSWQLTGLVDFEPAMLGAPEYDFASVGIFVSCAEPGLLRALLDGYGVRPDDVFPLRVMVYALLHRYGNLRWYLERLPAPEVAGDLERLARSWFTA